VETRKGTKTNRGDDGKGNAIPRKQLHSQPKSRRDRKNWRSLHRFFEYARYFHHARISGRIAARLLSPAILYVGGSPPELSAIFNGVNQGETPC
jgi:hypothetical protein